VTQHSQLRCVGFFARQQRARLVAGMIIDNNDFMVDGGERGGDLAHQRNCAARLVIHRRNDAKVRASLCGRRRPPEKGGVLVCILAIGHKRAHNRYRRTGHVGR